MLLVEFFTKLVGATPDATLVAQLQNPATDVAKVLGALGLTKNQIDVLKTQNETLIGNEIIAELRTACAATLAANPTV